MYFEAIVWIVISRIITGFPLNLENLENDSTPGKSWDFASVEKIPWIMIFNKTILLLKLQAYCGHILWCIHQGRGLKERMFSEIKTANSSNFVDVTTYGVRSPRLQLRWSSLFIVSSWIIFTPPRTWNDWHEVNQSNFWL